MKWTGGLILISLTVAVLLIANRHAGVKTVNKEKQVTQHAGAVRDTPNAGPNLYYLEHPYLRRAHDLKNESKYDSAIYYYKEAALKFEKEKQWENYVWVNGYISRLYLNVTGMNYEDALPYLQNALEKGEKFISSNHPYHAAAINYYGMYYFKKKMAEKSLEMHRKALKIIVNHYGEKSLYASDVYYAMGNVYAWLMSDDTEAEKHYLKGIKINEALTGEEKNSTLTLGYYNLMSIKSMTGDYEKAQSYYYKAIQNVGYMKHHKSSGLEYLEEAMANIYTWQKKYPNAIAKLNDAIRINLESNGDKGHLSSYYTTLGGIYCEVEKYDSALFYYNKALALKHFPSGYSDKESRVAYTFSLMGKTFVRLKKYGTALSYLKKSLDIKLKKYGRQHIETAPDFDEIGSAFQQAGLADSALNYYHLAVLSYAKNFTNPEQYAVPSVSNLNRSIYTFQVVSHKALALKQAHQQNPSDKRLLPAALDYYSLADSLVTMFRSDYDWESAKLAFTKSNYNIYEEAVDCAYLLHTSGTGHEQQKQTGYYHHTRRAFILYTIRNAYQQNIGRERNRLPEPGLPG